MLTDYRGAEGRQPVDKRKPTIPERGFDLCGEKTQRKSIALTDGEKKN